MSDVTVRNIAVAFGIAPQAVQPITRGHINTTYLVIGASGDVILQRVNESIFPDIDGMTANIAAVTRHLGGAVVPEPIPTVDGAWCRRDASGTWRAWRRIAGAEPCATPTVNSVNAAAQLLGQFHVALLDLDSRALTVTLPGFHDPERRLRALEAAVSADPCGRVADVRAEVASTRAHAHLAAIAADLAATVPSRVAHGDAKLDNFLFRGERAVALVDLDTVMPGAWFWDVGDLVRSASTTASEDDPDASFDAALYDATVAGYLLAVSGVPLTATERDAIGVAGAIVTYEQAVRFLTDWIAGDVYYRTTRPAQNRDRARSQLRILQSMPGAVG